MAHNEEIVAKFGASTEGFDRALKDMRHKVKETGREISEHLAAAFSVAAIIAGIERVFEKVHALKVEASSLGVGTDFLQGFKEVAENFGPGEEGGVKGLGKLAQLMGELQVGSDEAAKAFQKWGFTIKDVAGKDSEEMLLAIADKMKGIEDPTLRVAMAMDLLGKSGKEMVGMLSMGSEELKHHMEEAAKLSEGEAKSVEEAHHAIKEFGDRTTVILGKVVSAWGGFWAKLGKLSTGFDTIAKSNAEQARQELAESRRRIKAKLDAEEEAAKRSADIAGKAEKQKEDKLRPYLKRFHDAQKEIELRSKGFSEGDAPFLEEKIKQDQDAIDELQKSLDAVGNDEIEQARVQADLEQAKLQKLKDEEALRKKKADDEAKSIEAAKVLKQEQSKILQDFKELVDRKREARNANYMPTLQDVATIGGPFGGMAQQYLHNQIMAKQAFATGNSALGNQLVNANEGYDATDPTFKVWRQDATGGHLVTVGGAKHHVQGIRETLEKNGVISPEKTMEELNKRMAELVALAGQKGIKLDLPE